MSLPTPINWLGRIPLQKPLYYWQWSNIHGTSWTQAGAFEGWKNAIMDTLIFHGAWDERYTPQIISDDTNVGDRIDANVRRWIDFMVDKQHLPHDGPFILYHEQLRIEFSREYLPPLLDTEDDDEVSLHKYRELDSKAPFDSEYFESMWGEKQVWQDDWELVDWVVVDLSPDVYWGYIIKIS